MSINIQEVDILIIILLNIYIIKSEYKIKKIPNKLLILLLFFNFLHFFINSTDIYLAPTIIKTSFLAIGIGILYFFKIWTPSYLKYILVSSIFFLGNGEITYLSNIFFLVGIYIIIYFFYFYIKILLNPKNLKTYLQPLKEKSKGKIHNWILKNKNYLIPKIIIGILGFLAVFIIIRIIRFFIQGEIKHIYKIIEINNITINTFIILFIGLMIIMALLHKLYHKYILNNYKYLLILIFTSILFIGYEFIYDYDFINNYLNKILTFLIFIFILRRILVHMGKYLFFDNDSTIIDYKQLKAGNIIDKTIISSYLIGQKSLKNDDIVNFIKSIDNPISKEQSTQLKFLIEKNSNFQKKEGKTLPPNTIRIYNTFIFSPFIFGSFLLTLSTGENLLVNIIIYVFKKEIGLN